MPKDVPSRQRRYDLPSRSLSVIKPTGTGVEVTVGGPPGTAVAVAVAVGAGTMVDIGGGADWPSALDPVPTNVGQPPQSSTTVIGRCIPCDGSWRRNTKVMSAIGVGSTCSKLPGTSRWLPMVT